MKKKFDPIYWSPDKLLSYNKLFNFVIGNRGGGKSFAGKRIAINNFLKKGEQFVYVRRYRNEFEFIGTFFSDIEEFYPEHTFEVRAGKFYCDEEVMGYYIPLSLSSKYKSNSYPNVSFIIFDEFIIDKGRISYLKDEVTVFLDLYETIARMRDVRVLFISNAISSVNPYFLYFKIAINRETKFFRSQEIVCEYYKGDEYTNKKKETRFGRLISGTAYGDYAIENEFFKDNKEFIEKSKGNLAPILNIKYARKRFSVWYSKDEGYYYVSETKDTPEGTKTFCFFNEDHMPNVTLINNVRLMPIFLNIIRAYELSYVRFDSLVSKEIFCECMNLI